MNLKRFSKLFIVYMILIPAAWLLSIMVAGGVGGYIGGQMIAKAYSDPQTSNELCEFMKKHGFTASMAKEESRLQFEKLSPQEKAEYKKILFKSVKIDDIFGFGSIFVICVIVFSFIGFLSGILTKMWIPAGIFPIIVLSLEDPLRHFIVYGFMSNIQKVITVVIGQFIICYVFAYIGALLAKRFSKNKNTNLPVHSDAPKGGA
jgi:hypothetical protein